MPPDRSSCNTWGARPRIARSLRMWTRRAQAGERGQVSGGRRAGAGERGERACRAGGRRADAAWHASRAAWRRRVAAARGRDTWRRRVIAVRGGGTWRASRAAWRRRVIAVRGRGTWRRRRCAPRSQWCACVSSIGRYLGRRSMGTRGARKTFCVDGSTHSWPASTVRT
jgi:hypothetical protein